MYVMKIKGGIVLKPKRVLPIALGAAMAISIICFTLSGCGSSQNNDYEPFGNIMDYKADNESIKIDSIVEEKSKINRKKYTGSVDKSYGYYTDMSEGTVKFIDKSNEKYINDGFREFYSKTGVFPHLYIIENAPNSSDVKNSMQEYADKLYEQLFNIEGNLLFVYVASEDDYWVVGGYNIGDIIDKDAISIIYREINSRWDDGNLAKRFGDALEEAASLIMDEQ